MEHDAESTAGGHFEATFPIVGIGASAGGLEACLQLFGHLRASGLAVVVIQHLDPTHESKLGELLAKATPMQVVTASEGDRVLPGCVYVIPPNVGLVIANGLLHLNPRPEGPGRHMPIDLFLRSLAADRTTGAVGVVLSGTGSDGTLGLAAIQSEGGLTFAQDATAKFDAMPRSAIAAGCVDFVLPPEEIGRRLADIAARGRILVSSTGDGATADEQALVPLLDTLRAATGVDFTQYRRSTVRRRVQRRMAVHHLDSLPAYADMLARDPREAAVLAEDVLIHVTSFFRDPEAFEALKTQVFPRLLANRPAGTPIRVWVPGCSTGEEVYSIAIVLSEFLADAKADVPVKLFGTDISEPALEKARTARYVENISLDVSPERLRRFFAMTEGSYRIQRTIRDMCVFAKHDVTRDPPFSNMDLVSCRNVLIYLGPPLQGRVLPVLHYALNDRGFLLLGGSEGVAAFPGFTVVDPKNKIFARNPLPSPRLLDFTSRTMSATPIAAHPGPHAATQLEIQKEADRAVLGEYLPSGVVVTDDLVILQFRGETGAYLQPAAGVATFDLLRMARDDLRLELRQVMDESRKTGKPAHREVETERGVVDLGVVPFTAAALQRPLYAIVFDERPAPAPPAGVAPQPSAGDADKHLRSELAQTREYLQSVIEQLEAGNEELKAANEEIVSSNEELQSTNEELQTAKEELQAANEELATINQEMMERNREATLLSDDLANVLTSASIPMVILSRDGKIRRFTPVAGKLLHLIAADVGRPLVDIKPIFEGTDLMAIVTEVLDRLSPVEPLVKDSSGHWYSLIVRPYMTLDNHIDGTVVVLLDVDALKKGEEAMASARELSGSIVDTVREGLVVLDEDLSVRLANRAFCRHFELSPEDIVRRSLLEVGGGAWNDPALAQALRTVSQGGTVDGLRLEGEFPKIGRRVLVLNGRRFEARGLRAAWILLAVEDVTEGARSEEALRDMLSSAAEPILMSDANGRVVFANPAAHRVFGYAAGEILGQPIELLVPERLRSTHEKHRAGAGEAMVARAMGRGGIEVAGRRKDGSEFAAEIALTPMKGAAGSLVVAFVTDVSERRAQERRILEYQEKLRHVAFDAVVSEEHERRQIAINLHDGVGQSLALAQNKLSLARTSLEGDSRITVDECIHLLDESITQMRSLTFDLSPPILYDLGLEPALQWLVEQMERRYGIRVAIEGDRELDMSPEAAAMAFRAVRELLTNVCKHADTPSARVTLQQRGERVGITVEDVGVGFDVSAAESAETGTGFGLFSVREQIERFGGSMEVQSSPREGTRVSLTVPGSKRPAVPSREEESS